MSTDFEHLTDEELARDLYLSLIAHDDALPDHVNELFRPSVKMATALWVRIKGPYCCEPGCTNLHTPSFPWCAEHLAKKVQR